jgi:hypothetical protein
MVDFKYRVTVDPPGVPWSSSEGVTVSDCDVDSTTRHLTTSTTSTKIGGGVRLFLTDQGPADWWAMAATTDRVVAEQEQG